MSKSGSWWRAKKRERNATEHRRIVAEADATYRAYFENWGAEGARYRAAVESALRDGSGVDLTWRKSKIDAPSTLALDDLAVVLLAVEGFGESKGGLSIRRVMTAYEVCKIKRQRAKAVAALRVLQQLNLIQQTAPYKKGKHGKRYKACDKK